MYFENICGRFDWWQYSGLPGLPFIVKEMSLIREILRENMKMRDEFFESSKLYYRKNFLFEHPS